MDSMVSLIVWLVIQAGGYQQVDLLMHTENGISVAGAPDRPILFAYIIYYGVIFLFTFLAVMIGRRAGCHTVCWMAPFMIMGRWIRNRIAWPSLRLKAEAAKCTNCLTCTWNCPMSLDVNGMVQKEKMENSECVLCGSCVDYCPEKVIHYVYKSGK